MKINTAFYVSVLCMLLCIFNTACIKKSDIEKVNSLQNDSIYPEKGINVTLDITDSGAVICRVKSPLMERFSGKSPYIEMKKGLTAYFYDKQGNKENQLDANYGISYDNQKKIEVRNDVRLENVKGERLNTEKLIWDQATQKIYTDEFVKITRPDEIIYGDGFESNQNFTEYRIYKFRGTLSLKDNKKDSTNVKGN